MTSYRFWATSWADAQRQYWDGEINTAAEQQRISKKLDYTERTSNWVRRQQYLQGFLPSRGG